MKYSLSAGARRALISKRRIEAALRRARPSGRSVRIVGTASASFRSSARAMGAAVS